MLRNLLKLRKKIKRKKPKFKRQEWFRQKCLGIKWRRPKGSQSKLRKGIKGRGKVPKPSYGSPKEVRGLNSLGYKEIRVFNIKDLEKINPEKEIIVIGSTVGKKKRTEIIKRADELGIKISNR